MGAVGGKGLALHGAVAVMVGGRAGYGQTRAEYHKEVNMKCLFQLLPVTVFLVLFSSLPSWASLALSALLSLCPWLFRLPSPPLLLFSLFSVSLPLCLSFSCLPPFSFCLPLLLSCCASSSSPLAVSARALLSLRRSLQEAVQTHCACKWLLFIPSRAFGH